jgi:LPXTG-motif cell wall-anchored protein
MKKISAVLVLTLLLGLFAFPASAANFKDSVEQKQAPTVTTITDKTGETIKDKDGNAASAVIRDKSGNTVVGISATEIVITAVADTSASTELTQEAQEKMDNAYEQIQNVSSLAELVPELDNILETLGFEGTSDDLVVQDLFDVTVSDDVLEYLAAGNTLTLRFDLGLNPDDIAVVLHNYEDDLWEVVDSVVNEDGSVDATFTSLSPVAIAVDSLNVEVDTSDDAPTSPQTGTDHSVTWIVMAALMICAVAVGAVLIRRKKMAN